MDTSPTVTPALQAARVSIASTFFIHAFLSGSWAPRIPTITDELRLDPSELGVALAGLAVGLLVGTRLVTPTLARRGMRVPIRIALSLQCAALVGLALAPNAAMLTLAFVALGLVSGFMDVAMNSNAVLVERGHARPIMSGLHGIWSLGLLAGSATATAAAALGASLVVHFAVVAVALSISSAYATRNLLSESLARPRRVVTGTPEPESRAWSSGVLLLGLVAFAAFAGEGSAADWSALYLHTTIGTGTGSAGLAFVAFSLGMIGSRFASDRASARLGPVLVTRAGGSLAAVGLTLALAIPEPAPAIAGFLLFGLGFGPIVPTAFSAAGNVVEPRTGATLASVVTIAYLGGILGPLVIGFVADAYGLRVALVLPLLLAGTAVALAFSVGGAAGGKRPARPGRR